MYDEDALYNDIKQNIITTGKTAYSLFEQISKLMNEKTVDNGFVFTGQSTDLRYFEDFNEMPVSMIDNIPDENLKNTVRNEFSKAILSGKVELDNERGIISITEKGREFLERPEFKRAAYSDLSSAVQQQSQTIGFELNGTVQDLNFFNHADELHLADIVASPDKEAVQNVLANLQKMKESGLISVSDSVVKITDKGKNILNSDLFKLASKSAAKGAANAAVESAVGAVGSVPGVVVVAVKKAAEVSLKAASNLIKK